MYWKSLNADKLSVIIILNRVKFKSTLKNHFMSHENHWLVTLSEDDDIDDREIKICIVNVKYNVKN